jgi:fatty-acyl-CoA synthase
MTDAGARCEDRMIGEIWFRGPSVARGYFGDASATEATFNGGGAGWLRTGDLGFLDGGEVFICGRAKDLIILNGKNHYPEDIERVVSKIDGVREGQCVAFSRLGPDGAERAVIVAESRKGGAEGEAIAKTIAQVVRAEAGVVIEEVVLIKRTTLPKTSSGKVRRRETKRRLEAGELELIGDSASTPSLIPPSMDVAVESPDSGEATCASVKTTRGEVADGIE